VCILAVMKQALRRIGLINPRREVWAKNERITEVLKQSHHFIKAWYSPPLSLLTIAGLTPAGIEVALVSEDFKEVDYAAAFDLVGITAMIQNAKRAYEIADGFRAQGTYVVIGGIHPTVLPEDTLRHADTVIVGEAEELWPRFLQDFENGEPQKIYRNPPGHHVDLTKSPMPRYDLLNARNSLLDTQNFYNFIPVQASRGCPHACDFCLVSDIYGKKGRRKTIEQVRAEVLAIKRHLPTRLIGFIDDNLFLDRRFGRELVEALVDLKVRWATQTDISIGADSELLELIRRSGCLFLFIGFESLDTVNLNGINRNKWKLRQLANYETYVRNIQEHGIMVFGAFITCLDHDDVGVFARTVDFMDRNHITGQITVATPFPGTKMYERLKSEGRFLYPEPFWDHCSFFDVLFRLKRMTKEEAEEGLIWAYQQVFNEKALLKRTAYIKEIYRNLA
jgi:radical SAM superfamily enzyme YgiQ (UPF0313 family)